MTACCIVMPASADAASPLPAIAIPSAQQAAIDPTGVMTFERVRAQLALAPPASVRLPGSASAFHRVVLWVRLTAPPPGECYASASPSVG